MNYLVIDVGGSAIKYASMNDAYEFLESGKEETPATCFEDFKSIIKGLYEKFDNVEGVAMSLPGMINQQTNTMQIPGALVYNQDIPILQELKSVTCDNFTIENDAKCAALCELELVSLKGTEVGAVCILGTGIGGAITLKDKVWKGFTGFAGEFSYVSTNWYGSQSFALFWGRTHSVLCLIETVKEYCQIEEGIDGKKVFEMCNAGNTLALKALKEYCDGIAVGLYNLQAYVDPEKIAIGGGISKQPILMEYIQKAIDAIYNAIPIPIPRVSLTTCEYFNDSNLIGALVNYKHRYNK